MRKQCEHCPWKKSTDPYDIPGGYDVDKHRALKSTIVSGTRSLRNDRAMSCHEYPSEDRMPCVGWLHNQLGAGNNIGLRLAVVVGQIDGDYELGGPQHDRFEDTLPGSEEIT